MKKILLVSPYSEIEAMWVTGEETAEVRSNFPPLGLATIAALTPPDEFEVRIWDENVHGRISRKHPVVEHFDLVGVTGYVNHLPRCRQIAKIFRERGIPVAVGGPGISATPFHFRDDFDIFFINEAEHTWPQFLRDWQLGQHRSEYRQIDKPDLATSPAPRWDSLASDMKHYAMGTVQTTRGCPFDCEFCDVIYLFGRRPRHKPIERVLDEVCAFERFGMKTILFCDDEFSGDRPYSKELLRALIELNKTFDEPRTFTTQVSMAMSKDDEFLDLMARANFDLVFVGVESVNEEALKGANKHQNLRGDLCENIHRVLSYGIGIRAGMIVGFDEDGTDIFERQHRFIQDSCLTSVGISILKAPTGTRLWSRLMREGRVVVDLSWYSGLLGHLRTQTNILPKRMSRIELMQGYKWLLERVYPWDAFAERVCGFVSLVNRPPSEAVVPESRAQAVERLSDVLADPEAARAIGRIFDHVERVAPHLMSKARTVIAQHARYSKTVRDLLPEIDRQVQLESSGIVVPKPDRGAVPPSKEFRAEFDRVFPEIHRRVYANLAEKTLIPEALTEIFVDFLVRWGEEVQTIDAHHVSFLHEISDRTCAKLNGVPPESFVAVSTSETSVPNIGRMRLADDIYKNVWMDLSELRLKEIRSQEGARPFSAFLEPASRFGPDDGSVKETS